MTSALPSSDSASPPALNWAPRRRLPRLTPKQVRPYRLIVHFASAEPSHAKARYFGVEKRAYLNHVKAAIQRFARRLIDEADPVDNLSRATMTALMDSWNEMILGEEVWQRWGDE